MDTFSAHYFPVSVLLKKVIVHHSYSTKYFLRQTLSFTFVNLKVCLAKV